MPGESLLNWLVFCFSDFPEYYDNSQLDERPPNSSSYFSGVYLGDGRTNCDFGVDLPDKKRY